MDWPLIAKSAVFIVALGAAFACVLAGALCAIAGALGDGLMARQGAVVKIALPAVAIFVGLAIAVAGTVRFMAAIPR